MARGMWQGINAGMQDIKRGMANDRNTAAADQARQFQQGLMLRNEARQEKAQQRQEEALQLKMKQEAGAQALAMNPGLMAEMSAPGVADQPGMMGSTQAGPANPNLGMLPTASFAPAPAMTAARNYRTPEQLNAMAIAKSLATKNPVQPKTVTVDGSVYILNPDGTKGTRLGAAKTDKTQRIEVGPDGEVIITDGAQPIDPGNAGLKSFNRVANKGFAEKYGALGDEITNANYVQRLTQSARALFDSGLETGALEPFKNKVASIAAGFGIDPSKLGLKSAASAEAMRSVVMRNLLQELAKQKGPQTEGDAQRAMQTFISLGNTPAANAFILDYMDAWARYGAEKSEYILENQQKNGNNYNRSILDWSKHFGSKPFFAASKATGLPVTFYKYKDQLLEKFPGMTPGQVNTAWSKFTRGK